MFEEGPERGFRKLSLEQFYARYKDFVRIGAGTFGEVEKARTMHGGYVAIKKFKPSLVQCFWLINRETSNLRRLEHPNIVHFYDCFIVDDNKYYLVTEYCEGGTLYDFLQQRHSQNELLLACKQIAEGLAFAHQQGVVHRDLKPQNILVGRKGIMKIGDFGSSKHSEGSTVLQSRVGSLAYMDQRVNGQEVYDNTCDIYSLGLVFTAVFGYGKGIYDDCINQFELNQMQTKIYSDYHNNIQPYLANLPAIIRPIVETCLSYEHKKRLSAAEIAQKLGEYLLSQRSPSKILSTQESVFEEHGEDEATRFACQLIAKRKAIKDRMISQNAQAKLFAKMKTRKEAVDRLVVLENLNVSADIRAQYAFLVVFAYFWWLDGVRSVLRGGHAWAELAQLRLDSLDSSSVSLTIRYIEQEFKRLRPFVLRCAKRIQPLFRLMKNAQYKPDRFRDMVKGFIDDRVDYDSYDGHELIENIRLFMERRVKREFNQGGKGGQEETLLSLETIPLDFA